MENCYKQNQSENMEANENLEDKNNIVKHYSNM